VRERLAVACVGLAADCDEPDPRIEALFRTGLPRASTLPFVGIVTPDLRWVTGWAGSVGADEVVGHIALAENCRACKRSVVPSAAPLATAPGMPRPTAPTATPAPVPAPAPAPVKTPAPVVGTTATPRPAQPVLAGAPTTATPPPAPPVPGAVPPAVAALEEAKRQASDLLSRARSADASGAYAAVLWLDQEAGKLAVRSEPEAWKVIVDRACGWCEGCLRHAAEAAKARRTEEAKGLLAAVRRDAAGRPAAVEAENGERAMKAMASVDAMPAADRAKAMSDARTQFVGTRWATIFE
jgi:hypothetical protein